MLIKLKAYILRPVWILIIPALIHWIASGFQLYPVDTRLTLYFHSGIIILLAHGIQLPGRLLYSKILVGLVLTLYLMVPSLEKSWENFKEPRYGEHIRPVLESVSRSLEPEDLVYVYCSSIPAYLYYEPIIFQNKVKSVYGKKLDDPEAFRKQVAKLSGRTWFVFSHPVPAEGIEHIALHIESLNLPKLQEFIAPNARSFLVQLP